MFEHHARVAARVCRVGQRSSVAVSIMEQPSDLGPAKSIAWFCKPTYNRGRFVRFTRA